MLYSFPLNLKKKIFLEMFIWYFMQQLNTAFKGLLRVLFMKRWQLRFSSLSSVIDHGSMMVNPATPTHKKF
jgi:hypothetical protein